ncbi:MULTISPECIES: hypothetical protein [Paenarthrobacter]|jgi:hypothetical protein|uniref:Fluoride ion transporter CrcB n=1 Tax=Paenarthrobacter ureafaciens TaxID=37931 RepID=A0AAX3EE54_PAEUR|nr:MULTISPECIES: hypothetical protein [Paenarthrobacter]NKR13403.1 hypothetical protein [Arthrobacter sp. M5]NKR14747.1 hypothetical protein [Arthrobacter sp. M6]OEH62308.1 hypothetical protein A5N13_01170 [Arthrobacter sp. D4]OEH62879.1 hypothetical protein A5N17_09410 [Arthrobacter sp. D2]HKU34601.1 hypothetical protein [Paenarthrobacter sp.]
MEHSTAPAIAAPVMMLVVGAGALAGSLIRTLLQRLLGDTRTRKIWAAETGTALVLGLITGAIVAAAGPGPLSALGLGAASGLCTYAGTCFALSVQAEGHGGFTVPATHLAVALLASIVGTAAAVTSSAFIS